MTQANAKINRYQHYDANTDAGYGRTSAKFHKQRSFNQYPEPVVRDPVADAAIDDETYYAVLDKLLSYVPGDEYAKNGTDPFHFVDGATNIAELSTAKGMVPFPKMYQSKQAVAGGTAQRLPAGPTLGFRTRVRPTGTKKGFSSAPYPEYYDDEGTEPKMNFTDIIDADLEKDHVDLIKKMVDLIHLEQQR